MAFDRSMVSRLDDTSAIQVNPDRVSLGGGEGSGLAAMLAGYIMTSDEAGRLVHYDWVGYISCGLTLVGMWVAWKVKPIS